MQKLVLAFLGVALSLSCARSTLEGAAEGAPPMIDNPSIVISNIVLVNDEEIHFHLTNKTRHNIKVARPVFPTVVTIRFASNAIIQHPVYNFNSKYKPSNDLVELEPGQSLVGKIQIDKLVEVKAMGSQKIVCRIEYDDRFVFDDVNVDKVIRLVGPCTSKEVVLKFSGGSVSLESREN